MSEPVGAGVVLMAAGRPADALKAALGLGPAAPMAIIAACRPRLAEEAVGTGATADAGALLLTLAPAAAAEVACMPACLAVRSSSSRRTYRRNILGSNGTPASSSC